MAAFRAFSDRIPFRERSETAAIAIELSLQPWQAFRPDGVIMFSDILTPLPALGIEFDVVKGKGPVIETPINECVAGARARRGGVCLRAARPEAHHRALLPPRPRHAHSMDQIRGLRAMDDPLSRLPFVHETLSTLRAELRGSGATLLGFIGTPWTLAAYSVEGKAERNCRRTKGMMFNSPAVLHALLAHLSDALVEYACYQIEAGAQVVQLFDSWAHHLSPEQFAEFSLPYAERVMAGVRARHPHVPLIFHANGGAGKHAQLAACSAGEGGDDDGGAGGRVWRAGARRSEV